MPESRGEFINYYNLPIFVPTRRRKHAYNGLTSVRHQYCTRRVAGAAPPAAVNAIIITVLINNSCQLWEFRYHVWHGNLSMTGIRPY